MSGVLTHTTAPITVYALADLPEAHRAACTARGSQQLPQNREAGARQDARFSGTHCHTALLVRYKGKHLSHAIGAQPATKPAANSLSASEPWNLVADGYAETTMLVFEQFANEAIAASKLKPNSTVLDVACGPGTLALKLARTANKVHGIDFSESMLAVLRNKIEQAGHRNITLHCGDAQTLPTQKKPLTSDAWLGAGVK